jgi:hypothetical protein
LTNIIVHLISRKLMRQKLTWHPGMRLWLRLWLMEILILIVFILAVSNHLIRIIWNNLMLF